MGNNRTIFIWDHLQNFYSLNNLLSKTSSSSAVKLSQQLKPSVRVEGALACGASGLENKNLNFNKKINSVPKNPETRKYSTSSKTNTSALVAKGTLRVSNLVNIKNINDLKLNNNNMIVSSVVYDNAEEYKDLILADNKNKAGIYVWTHRESSKKYIGSSVNLSRRLSYYFSQNIKKYKTSKIYNALISYGFSAFSLTILEYTDIVNLPKDEIKKLIIGREQYYIDNILPEYNILKIAGSLLGFQHSSSTIVKLKKANENEKWKMKTTLCLESFILQRLY